MRKMQDETLAGGEEKEWGSTHVVAVRKHAEDLARPRDGGDPVGTIPSAALSSSHLPDPNADGSKGRDFGGRLENALADIFRFAVSVTDSRAGWDSVFGGHFGRIPAW